MDLDHALVKIVVWFGLGHLPSLGLSFVICKMTAALSDPFCSNIPSFWLVKAGIQPFRLIAPAEVADATLW